jgi:hypothetical protein
MKFKVGDYIRNVDSTIDDRVWKIIALAFDENQYVLDLKFFVNIAIPYSYSIIGDCSLKPFVSYGEVILTDRTMEKVSDEEILQLEMEQ